MKTQTEIFLERLEKMLQDVVATFGQTMEPASWASKREQYAAALIVLAKFFDGIGRHGEGRLFFELASALADRNKGVTHPLLDADLPEEVARAPDPSRIWRARANAVLALEALIATGESPAAAAAKIATANESLSFLAGAKAGPMKNTLLNWRKQFRKKGVKIFEATELFEAGRDLIEARKGNTAELHAIFRDQVLRALAVAAGG
jgi:hypothetical protein